VWISSIITVSPIRLFLGHSYDGRPDRAQLWNKLIRSIAVAAKCCIGQTRDPRMQYVALECRVGRRNDAMRWNLRAEDLINATELRGWPGLVYRSALPTPPVAAAYLGPVLVTPSLRYRAGGVSADRPHRWKNRSRCRSR